MVPSFWFCRLQPSDACPCLWTWISGFLGLSALGANLSFCPPLVSIALLPPKVPLLGPSCWPLFSDHPSARESCSSPQSDHPESGPQPASQRASVSPAVRAVSVSQHVTSYFSRFFIGSFSFDVLYFYSVAFLRRISSLDFFLNLLLIFFF